MQQNKKRNICCGKVAVVLSFTVHCRIPVCSFSLV
uniref:Uncharacterized protein n=1 Tax=Anguilla anguilla TaxID=7936 RepID=A0A0E9SSM1_ANGAN